MDEELLDRLRSLTIDCPECEDMYSDDQYTCTTCWCMGGQGTINAFEYLSENPKLLTKKD